MTPEAPRIQTATLPRNGTPGAAASVREAGRTEIPELARVVNLAYRVEDFFINGDRTNERDIADHLEHGRFLVVGPAGGTLAAGVFMSITDGRGYFGMLSVDPAHQGLGLGRLLVNEVESRAAGAGCTAVDLVVVNLREELPPWYHKLGYRETGVSPFPDPAKLKMPAHCITMSKPLAPSRAGAITQEVTP
ncbi:MAG: GNAT family N-acetyltransferase [Chloroflexi bacterium]|nr:GNAT family N-acetyltransferase [Chloroflexota bacterium]